MTDYKIPDRAKRSNGISKYQRHLYATCPPYKERKGAFTLTELLVAISIIGIVAVLTVPFITGNTFGQSYRAKAESVRELILASANSVFMRERVDSLEDSSLYLNKEAYFNNYIKTSKTCGTTAGECFAASYKTNSGNKTVGQFFNAGSRYYVTLQNGVSIAALTGSEIPSNQAYFIVDANGKHGPNTLGVDMYVFNVHSDGTAGVFGSDEAVIAYNDNVEPDPTEATTPTTPTDPTESTTPTEPTESTTPTEPTQQTQPTEPTHPTGHTFQTFPTAPTIPTSPTRPTISTDPTRPTLPTADPTMPTVPTDPTMPTDPEEPNGQCTQEELGCAHDGTVEYNGVTYTCRAYGMVGFGGSYGSGTCITSFYNNLSWNPNDRLMRVKGRHVIGLPSHLSDNEFFCEPTGSTYFVCKRPSSCQYNLNCPATSWPPQ